MVEHIIRIKNEGGGTSSGGLGGGGPRDTSAKDIERVLDKLYRAIVTGKKETGTPIVVNNQSGTDARVLKQIFDKLSKEISSSQTPINTKRIEDLLTQILKQQSSSNPSGKPNTPKPVDLDVSNLSKVIMSEIKKHNIKIQIIPEIDEKNIKTKIIDTAKSAAKEAGRIVANELANATSERLGIDVDINKIREKLSTLKKEFGSLSTDSTVNIKFMGEASAKKELSAKIDELVRKIELISTVRPEVVVSLKGDSGKSLTDEIEDIKNLLYSTKGATAGNLKVNLPKVDELKKIYSQLLDLSEKINIEINIISNIDDIKDVIKDIEKTDIKVDVKFNFSEAEKALKSFEDRIEKELSDLASGVKDKLLGELGQAKKVLDISNRYYSATTQDIKTPANIKSRAATGRDQAITHVQTTYGTPEAQDKTIIAAGGKIKKAISDAVDDASDALRKIGTDIKTSTKSDAGKILTDAISGVIDNTADALTQVSSDVKSGKASVKDVKDAAKKVTDSLGTAADSLVDGLVDAGKQIQKDITQQLDRLVPAQAGKSNIKMDVPISSPLRHKGPIPSYKTAAPAIQPGIPVFDAADLSGYKISDAVKNTIDKNISELGKSLGELQQYMVDSLEATFKESENKWKVVKNEGEKLTDFFVQKGGLTSKESKQWRLQIANVGAIKEETTKYKGMPIEDIKNIKDLIQSWRDDIINSNIKNFNASQSAVAEKIAGWLETTSKQDLGEWKTRSGGKLAYLDKLLDIKNKTIKSPEKISSSDLQKQIRDMVTDDFNQLAALYRETAGVTSARNEMTKIRPNNVGRLLTTVSIPAAKITSTGSPIFETGSGSQRGLSKFATYVSGFEELYNKLAELNVPERMTRFGPGVMQYTKKAPTAISAPDASKLVSGMLESLATSSKGPEQTAWIKEQYKKAGVMRGIKREQALGPGEAEKFSDKINTLSKSLEDADIKTFISEMGKAGVSVLDFAKSLDNIKFENVYDVYKKVFSGGKQPLRELGESPQFEKKISDFEKSVRQVEQLMPVINLGKPRRAYHQENVVNVLARTSPVLQEETLGPMEQKAFIKDLNLRFGEMLSETQMLEKMSTNKEKFFGSGRLEQLNLPPHLRALSSLGLPESQASTVALYKTKGYKPETEDNDFSEGIEYLKALNAVSVKMYSENLRELAPFATEFQQLGRNIANVTNAMSSSSTQLEKIGGMPISGGVTTEFPSLRTTREAELIKGGRYGTEGYGFNVIAEIRNTASTFEDQVLISGKLADALTVAVKNLIQPSSGGRLSSSSFGKDMVSDVRTGLVKDLPNAIEKVSRDFQEVLGIPESYKGRADKAFIEEVQKVISVVRGEDVEVQQAKLAELFLSHFGTKFTTRYGSKGVAALPISGAFQGQSEEETEAINRAIAKSLSNKQVKVLTQQEREKAGLGVALMPKSMGELAAEMLKLEEVGGSEDLQKELIASGNKFIIDMFKKASLGIVPQSEETDELNRIYKQFVEHFRDLFDDSDTDLEKIKKLQTAYSEKLGSKAKLFKEVPLDIRISSHGIAKRGLQTELMEMAMTNVAGAGGTGTTINTELGKPGYKYLLGGAGQRGAFADYMKALGFKGSTKEAAKSQIMQQLTSKVDMGSLSPEESKKLTEEFEKYAEKASDLESMFNMYSDVIDELGQRRRSLIGEKFVQIIEHPHMYQEWTKREVEQGKKGESLNLPAFSAYASIFGEESKLLDEIKQSSEESTKEHWEYIKALQLTLGNNSDARSKYLERVAKQITLDEISAFTAHTGVFDKSGAQEGSADRSFESTLFDLEKFPTEFLVDIPKTTKQAPYSKPEMEKFFVPGPLARGTYPEPLIAGEFGPKLIARRLQQVINAAKEASTAIQNPEELIPNESTLRKKVIYSVRDKIKGAKSIPEKQDLLNEFKTLLSKEPGSYQTVMPGRWAKGQNYSEADFLNAFQERTTGNEGERLTTTLNKAADLLIGPRDAIEGFSSHLDKTIGDTNKMLSFAKGLGVSPVQESIDRKLALLEKAKTAYYEELAKTVLGKTGSVATTFFTRKIPSAMAKAVSATTDKTKELETFKRSLSSMIDKYPGLGLESLSGTVKELEGIRAEHQLAVDQAVKSGLPVLKEHELGIPVSHAKKIPLKFTKKYAVKSLGSIDKDVSGTMFDLLKYKEALEFSMSKWKHKAKKESGGIVHPQLKEYFQQIQEYIDRELVPYIESVRYPFTGTSSVQPYKAKLVRGKKMKHVLAVPGMPDMDMESFDAVIEKVKGTRSKLFKQRESAWETGASQVEIDKLSRVITELDGAISKVIPKYIAHQQKLDYDGDSIQVHSATLSEAREDIKKHFDSVYNATNELSDAAEKTASVFRDQFTYEARQQPSGNYVLSEMMKTFHKKFPEEKGFDFLKSPFFTKELEYLPITKQVDVLSTITGAQPADIIEKAIRESIREESEQKTALDEIKNALQQPGADTESLLNALTSKETRGFVGEEIKTELMSKKYADAIEAQLFKIHTGPDVEKINRLRRLSEAHIGFGRGVAGGEYKPEPEFAKRWPTGLKMFGPEGPASEFHTMLNEFERFAIQKGMDVKHAGQLPVAGEMVTSLTKKGGVDKLLKSITEEEDYGELKKFAESNAEAIKNRLGKMSTEMIRSELQSLSELRDINIPDIGALKRPQLIDKVIEMIGLKGFLEELQRQIVADAKANATKPGLIDKEFETKGINIFKRITTPKQSLYPYRTFMGTPSTFKLPNEMFDPSRFASTGGEQLSGIKDSYLKAKGTAVSLEKTFRQLRSEGEGGGYGQMIQSTLDNLDRDRESMKQMTEDIIGLKNKLGNMDVLSPEVLLDLKKQVDTYSKIAGAPPLAKSEEYRVAEEMTSVFSEKAKAILPEPDSEDYEERVNKYVEREIEKVKSLKQLDKILMIIESKKAESLLFSSMFSKTPVELPRTLAGSVGGVEESERRMGKLFGRGHGEGGGYGTGGGVSMPPSAPGGELPPSMRVSDDVVKVFVVGVAEGVGLVLGDMPTGIKPKSTSAMKSNIDSFNDAVSSIGLSGEDDELWQTTLPPGGRLIPSESGTTRIPYLGDEYKKATEQAKSGVYEKYSRPRDIVSGSNITSVFENLKILHEQAAAYQETQSFISTLSIGNVEARKEIESILSATREEGPRHKEFIEATARMRDIDKTLSGSEIFKAWKLYRIAVGDFMIRQAEEAKARLDEAESAGDDYGAARAYSGFEASVANMQKYIKRVVGKPTDIYTERKTYLDPELAKAAGVFLTKAEIINKATEPLGEDNQLIELFNTLTRDLGRGSTPASPASKVRTVFKDLSNQNDELVEILLNAEQLKRMGPEVADAWDFKNIIDKISRLRVALEQLNKFKPDDMTADMEANLKNVIKYLKNVESSYVPFEITPKEDRKWGQMGTTKVPKYLEPNIQEAMHTANISKVREYFKKSEETGGPKIGEHYSYITKIFGDMGDVVKNTTTRFYKYGETVDAVGNKISLFKQKSVDIFKEKESSKSIGSAVGRAARWGAAATLVYGGVQYLQDSIETIKDVEYSIAELRMMMNPLETDFTRVQSAAASLAKEYGVSINAVLTSMKVFAQQGLKQIEVIDRSRTSTLAANITTLSANDATEALTAAMKVYSKEGESSIRFLDAWSEVESKHAVTANDLADALKKAASAAQVAGINFDEFNSIVTAIGSTTRQTGKEVGTSLKFMFSRLSAEKGPKELAKLGIPTFDIGEGGQKTLRGGYKILSDLAEQWDTLTNAQKMNVAQGIGGTRQYNSLIVLMDNWKEAQEAYTSSVNSKGSAERRNMELMKTYQKQLEQTKQAANELKLEFGKVYLPLAKFSLKGVRTFLEIMTNIPTSIKLAATAITMFFTYMAKGEGIIDSLANRIGQLFSWWGEGKDRLKTSSKTSLFEVFNVGNPLDKDLKGLKTLGQEPSQKLGDFQSALGKTAFQLSKFGKAYTNFTMGIVKDGGEAMSAIGEPLAEFGKKYSIVAGLTAGGKGGVRAAKEGFKKIVKDKGLDEEAVSGLFSSGSKGSFFKFAGRVAGFAATIATEIASLSSVALGKALDTMGESVGGFAGTVIKSFAGADAGFLRSIAPLALTVTALIPLYKTLSDVLKRNTMSAEDYEKSVYDIKMVKEADLKTTRELIESYKNLNTSIDKLNKSEEPGTKAALQDVGKYVSPLLQMISIQEKVIELSNKLADTNSASVIGYDKFGNAVISAAGNLNQYLSTLEKVQKKDLAQTNLNIVTKYASDLTQTEGPEKWKSVLKSIVRETPVVGEQTASLIKQSPARMLKEVTDYINKLKAAQSRNPLSTAFSKDLSELQKKLKEVRDGYKSTYAEFKKALSNIGTEGFSDEEIANIFKNKDLKSVFKLAIELEPKFKVPGVKGNVNWKEVLGAEVMQRTEGMKDIKNYYEATAELTKSKLESAGIQPRQENKAFTGDIVLFKRDTGPYEDLIKKFNIAGREARLKVEKSVDGVYEGIIEYFNTKTLKVERRPFDADLQNLVDSIFPVEPMKDEITLRAEQLTSFVAGAAAGLSGFSKKDFKREMDLGERFFSEIPTTTIIQGEKGYNPMTGGFGSSPFQKGWRDDFENLYVKAMDEYKNVIKSVQEAQKGSEDIDLSEEFQIPKNAINEIINALNVLKNNQVIFQFRAVFADLTKEMEASTRAVLENITAEKNRQSVQKETVGLMAGIAEGLDSFNLGIQNYSELTPEQRLLRRSDKFVKAASEVKLIGIEKSGIQDSLQAIDKAIIAVERIQQTSGGFGSIIKPEDLNKYVERIMKEISPGDEGIILETSRVVDGVKETNVVLKDILANQVGASAYSDDIRRLLEESKEAKGTSSLTSLGVGFASIMEKLAREREKQEKAGNFEQVASINSSLDDLSVALTKTMGLDAALKSVENYSTITSKRFTSDELMQRSFSGYDLNTVMEKMSEKLPGEKRKFWFDKPSLKESGEYKKLLELQKQDGAKASISSKTLVRMGADIATWKQFDKTYSNRVIDSLKEQIKINEEQISPLKTKKEGNIVLTSNEEDQLSKLNDQSASLAGALKKEEQALKRHKFLQTGAVMGGGFTEFAKTLGFTETQIKMVGSSALGLYALFKGLEFAGEDVPESFKKFDSILKKGLVKEGAGLGFGTISMVRLAKAGRDMVSDYEKERKEKLDMTPEQIKRFEEDIKVENTRTATKEQLEKGGQGTPTFKQLFLTTVADVMAAAAAQASEERTRIATLTGRSEDQTVAIRDILRDNPKETAQLLADLYAEETKTEKTIPKEEIVTPKAADVYKEGQKIKEDFEKIKTKDIENIEKLNEEERIRKIRLGIGRIFESIIKNIEDAIVSIQSKLKTFNIRNKFAGPAMLNRGLAGFPGEVEGSMKFSDMNAQQQLFSMMSKEVKSGFQKYAFATKELQPSEVSRLEELIQNQQKLIPPGKKFEDLTEISKKEYESLARQIESSYKSLEKFNAVLRQFGESARFVNELSSALKSLNDSVRSLSLKERMEDFFRSADRNLSKLYGGDHPNALQATTIEEQRRAITAGSPLKPFDTARNKERAELMYQYRTTASGPESHQIWQKLQDLDREYERKDMSYEMGKSFSRISQQVEVYKQAASSIAEVIESKRGLATSPEENAAVSKLSGINSYIETMVGRAGEVMTLGEKLRELGQHRQEFTPERYSEAEALIKNAGAQQYRGVTPWDQQTIEEALRGTTLDVSKAFEALNSMDLSGIITDPLHKELIKHTELLTSISRSLENDDQKKERLRKEKEEAESGRNFAFGGRIFGEGGPKEDKVPAMVSPGEFIIKADSAKRIGYDILSHMNKKGNVPRFALGGAVDIPGIPQDMAERILFYNNFLNDYEAASKEKDSFQALKDVAKKYNITTDVLRLREVQDKQLEEALGKRQIGRMEEDGISTEGLSAQGLGRSRKNEFMLERVWEKEGDAFAAQSILEAARSRRQLELPEEKGVFTKHQEEIDEIFRTQSPLRAGISATLTGIRQVFTDVRDDLLKRADIAKSIGEHDTNKGWRVTSQIAEQAIRMAAGFANVPGVFESLWSSAGAVIDDPKGAWEGAKKGAGKGWAYVRDNSFDEMIEDAGNTALKAGNSALNVITKALSGDTQELLDAATMGATFGLGKFKISPTGSIKMSTLLAIIKNPKVSSRALKLQEKIKTNEFKKLFGEPFEKISGAGIKKETVGGLFKKDIFPAKGLNKIFDSVFSKLPTDMKGDTVGALQNVFSHVSDSPTVGEIVLDAIKTLPSLKNFIPKSGISAVEKLTKAAEKKAAKEIKLATKSSLTARTSSVFKKFIEQGLGVKDRAWSKVSGTGKAVKDVIDVISGGVPGFMKPVISVGKKAVEKPFQVGKGITKGILETVRKFSADPLKQYAKKEFPGISSLTGKAIKESVKKVKEISEKMKTKKRPSFEEMVLSVKDTIPSILKEYSTYIEDFAPKTRIGMKDIKSGISIAGKITGRATKTTFDKTTGLIKPLAKKIKEQPLETTLGIPHIIDTLSAKGVPFTKKLKNLMFIPEIKNFMYDKLVPDNVKKLHTFTKNTYGKVSDVFGKVKHPISLTKDMYSLIKNFKFSNIKDLYKNIKEDPFSAFKKLFKNREKIRSIRNMFKKNRVETIEPSEIITPSDKPKSRLSGLRILRVSDIVGEVGGIPRVRTRDDILGAFDRSDLKKNLTTSKIFDFLNTDVKDIVGTIKEFDLKNKIGSIAKFLSRQQVEKKAAGGRIFGEGGPKEDKVPAMLSPGEFVVKASSAQKIGYNLLEQINKKGRVPFEYAEGGVVASEAYKQAIEYLNSTDPQAAEPDLKDKVSVIKEMSARLLSLKQVQDNYYMKRMVEEAATAEDFAAFYNNMAGYTNEIIPENERADYTPEKLLSLLPKPEFGQPKDASEKGWSQKLLEKYTKSVEAGGSSGVKAITGTDRQKQLKEMGFAEGGFVTTENYKNAMDYFFNTDPQAQEPEFKETTSLIKNMSDNLLSLKQVQDNYYMKRMVEEAATAENLSGFYNKMANYAGEIIPENERADYTPEKLLSLLPKPKFGQSQDVPEKSWSQKLLEKYTKSVEAGGSSGVKAITGTDRQKQLKEMGFAEGGVAGSDIFKSPVDYRVIVPSDFSGMSDEEKQKYMENLKRGKVEPALLPKGKELNWDSASSYLSQQYIYWQLKGNEAKMKEVMVQINELNKLRLAAGQPTLPSTTLPGDQAIKDYAEKRGVRTSQFASWETLTKETYDRMSKPLKEDEVGQPLPQRVKIQPFSASPLYEQRIKDNEVLSDVPAEYFAGYGEDAKIKQQLPSMRGAGIGIGNLSKLTPADETFRNLSGDVQRLVSINTDLNNLDVEALKKAGIDVDEGYIKESYDLLNNAYQRLAEGKSLFGDNAFNSSMNRLSALSKTISGYLGNKGGNTLFTSEDELSTLLGPSFGTVGSAPLTPAGENTSKTQTISEDDKQKAIFNKSVSDKLLPDKSEKTGFLGSIKNSFGKALDYFSYGNYDNNAFYTQSLGTNDVKKEDRKISDIKPKETKPLPSTMTWRELVSATQLYDQLSPEGEEAGKYIRQDILDAYHAGDNTKVKELYEQFSQRWDLPANEGIAKYLKERNEKLKIEAEEASATTKSKSATKNWLKEIIEELMGKASIRTSGISTVATANVYAREMATTMTNDQSKIYAAVASKLYGQGTQIGIPSMMHTGGEVQKTGRVLLQKGEFVVPGYASGGLIEALAGQSTTSSIGVGSNQNVKIEVDKKFEELVSRLETAFSNVPKVDFAEPPEVLLKVPEDGVHLNIPSDGVPIKLSDIPESIPVSLGDIPTLTVDATSAVESIKNAIDGLNNIKIDVSSNSVGADTDESMKKLTDIVNNLEEKLTTKIYNLEKEYTDDISIIKTNNSESKYEVKRIIDQEIAVLKTDIDAYSMKSRLSSLERSINTQYADKARIAALESTIKQLQNAQIRLK